MSVAVDIELEEVQQNCIGRWSWGLITNHAHEGLLRLVNVAFNHLDDSRVH